VPESRGQAIRGGGGGGGHHKSRQKSRQKRKRLPVTAPAAKSSSGIPGSRRRRLTITGAGYFQSPASRRRRRHFRFSRGGVRLRFRAGDAFPAFTATSASPSPTSAGRRNHRHSSPHNSDLFIFLFHLPANYFFSIPSFSLFCVFSSDYDTSAVTSIDAHFESL
jgi:hypothetical protein